VQCGPLANSAGDLKSFDKRTIYAMMPTRLAFLKSLLLSFPYSFLVLLISSLASIFPAFGFDQHGVRPLD
jgi:hypothetical protein